MRFFPRFGKMSLYSNPDPPVSEPRFGTIFGSDRYWGGSTAAGFGDDGAEKSIDEGSFPQTEQRNSSAVMRARVMEARARQEKRFADESISYNSQMTRRQIEEYCRLSGEDAVFLEKVERQQGISARGHGKILKVARTLADLDGQAEIGRAQLAEAIGFRSFEKKYWGSL